VDSVYFGGYPNLGFDRGTVPNQNGSVKKTRSNIQSKNPKLFPTTVNFPTCAGPNIHGGAEALLAGRLDVPDLFASFCIKPKRRRTAPKQNRLVKQPPLSPNNKPNHPAEKHLDLKALLPEKKIASKFQKSHLSRQFQVKSNRPDPLPQWAGPK
jgi:hypothetical protein